MAVIVDASVALCWFLPGQETPASLAILKQVSAEGVLVPSLWHLEVANHLGRRLRQRALSELDVTIAFELIAKLGVETDKHPWTAPAEIVAMMMKHNLTAYDAAYLELAIRVGAPLATFDNALLAAASTAGIPVVS